MRLPAFLASLAVGRQVRRAYDIQESPSLRSVARDLDRVESVREVKDVQRTFAQLAQFGRWADMAALFTQDGLFQWGDESVQGPAAIQAWLKTDAGAMDGVQPGSLYALVAENPLVTLSPDGKTAKGRFNGIRFMGDGAGATRIQGGIYENEYVYSGGRWRLSFLHHYAMYAGNYTHGWRNIDNKTIPIIPYHFTPDTVSPIPPPSDDAPATDATAAQLAKRIARLNNEDAVRNLQNSYGYYVDRRMWDDVVDLFGANASASVGAASYAGKDGVRRFLERMGPQGLTVGILNDRPIFDTIVHVDDNGAEAVARGFEIAMVGDVTAKTASWEFNLFRNVFAKDPVDGLWKFKAIHLSPLSVANYSAGWGKGSLAPQVTTPPGFLSTLGRTVEAKVIPLSPEDVAAGNVTVAELARRLARAAAYDGAENLSGAYGYYLDDLSCNNLGAIHARWGNKASPFTGWYQTPARVAGACKANYGEPKANVQRGSISFHWRPQPVILAATDGRSATLRARLLQPGTSLTGSGGFNGAIYHDQMALEDGHWRLWSITIDEHYWTSSWTSGWHNARLPNATATAAAPAASTTAANASRPASGGGLGAKYPPDILLTEVGEREATFRGGSGRTLNWPEIQIMWFQYRNPVTGRVPARYWPGCVPCRVRSGWNLTDRGYREPPTGPTRVTVTSGANIVNVRVAGGPDEPVAGTVELREAGRVRASTTIAALGATFTMPLDESPNVHTLTAVYLGSERLDPGHRVATVTVVGPPPFPTETSG